MRFAVPIVLIIALTGCSRVIPSMQSPAPATLSARGAAVSYKVLFRFDENTSGAYPQSGLVVYKGNLYGTTTTGGETGSGYFFSITPDGKMKIIFNFPVNASVNYGPLLFYKDEFYGTSYAGGKYQHGTVFKISPKGKYTLLYSFKGGKDAAYPESGLTDVGGIFYGTTVSGGKGSQCGSEGCGTLYAVTPEGKEHVVYSFPGGTKPGNPQGGVTYSSGLVYGTANSGGPYYQGALWSMDPNGKNLKIGHYFEGGANDGAQPSGNLVVQSGIVYGTTTYGGNYEQRAGHALRPRGGIGPGGRFSEVWPFDPKKYKWQTLRESDLKRLDKYPEHPNDSGLAYYNGWFYGVSQAGGAANNGTVFKMNSKGDVTVLHSFTGKSDGANPIGPPPVELNGKLYGVTDRGGSSANNGTIYEVSP